MSIYPLSPNGGDFKVGCIFGHSNADGWGSTSFLFDFFPDLLPTISPEDVPQLAYWKNIYIATSAQPITQLAGSPIASDIGDVQWLEMTVANPTSPGDTNHPHPSPYNYPNVRGGMYPRWGYNAGASGGGGALTNGSGTLHGIEIPLAWHLSHYWGDQIGMVKMAWSSSAFLRNDPGESATNWFDPFGYHTTFTPNDPLRPVGTTDATDGYLGYWTPRDHFDWVVNTDRFYGKWKQKMAGAKLALPAGVTMNVQFGLLWFGDNDAVARTSQFLTENFEPGIREFIKNFRHDCVHNGWTLLPRHQVRIILMKVHSGYPSGASPETDTVGICNEALERIAADDPFVRVIDVEDFDTMTDNGQTGLVVNPANHFGSSGYVEAATAVLEAIQEMDVEPFDAIAEEDRVTVETFMARVRTYYNRSRVQTDAEDETLLIHGNGALDQILNTIGDNAEFLRRRAQLTLSTDDEGLVTMPRYVMRVLRVEHPQQPDYPLQFELVNKGQGGKLQILLKERCHSNSTGTYFVHFHTRPREMTMQDEFVPLPRQLVEWLVCETAKRLSYSGTNVALQATLTGQCRELQERCMHNLMVDQRARKIRLRTQRRMPRMGYGQGFVPPWDNG